MGLETPHAAGLAAGAGGLQANFGVRNGIRQTTFSSDLLRSWAKIAQDGPKMGQDEPRCFQDAPKTVLTGSRAKIGQDVCNVLPKDPNIRIGHPEGDRSLGVGELFSLPV